jgi:hypothetical protein
MEMWFQQVELERWKMETNRQKHETYLKKKQEKEKN